MIKTRGHSSPTKQALLDLKNVGVDLAWLEEEITEEQFEEADILFNNHEYPNKKMTFVRTPNIEINPAFLALTPIENLVLDVLIRSISTDNLNSLSEDELAASTNLTTRTIRKALKTLRTKGFISLYEKPKKNHPAVYMINPDVIQTGKPIYRADDFYESNKAKETYMNIKEELKSHIDVSFTKHKGGKTFKSVFFKK